MGAGRHNAAPSVGDRRMEGFVSTIGVSGPGTIIWVVLSEEFGMRQVIYSQTISGRAPSQGDRHKTAIKRWDFCLSTCFVYKYFFDYKIINLTQTLKFRWNPPPAWISLTHLSTDIVHNPDSLFPQRVSSQCDGLAELWSQWFHSGLNRLSPRPCPCLGMVDFAHARKPTYYCSGRCSLALTPPFRLPPTAKRCYTPARCTGACALWAARGGGFGAGYRPAQRLAVSAA